ncbi:MAG: hypothetical protein QNL88_05410 [Acidobacteriota bacterium]|nr:hypothetical protein [Acidobacteriota bacterium]
MLVPNVVSAETIDPDNDDSQHAWTENTGWINAEPRGDGGPGMHIAAGWIKGWLWSENLGWISMSCDNTASCGTVDYQVQHERDGKVTGFAWSENAGWISFSCENTGSCSTVDYSVTIDLGTGELTGFAWSENVGWISLSCSNTASCATVDFGVDTVVPFPDHLFVDGFESGNTMVWSTSVG